MHDSDEPSEKLRGLSRSALSRRLDALIAALDEGSGAGDQRALLLDLQAHQIELEMQGRELQEARQELEVSRDRYARLFDLAPVGHVVLDRHGRIREINLAAARMLRRPRCALIDTPMTACLAAGDMRALLSHLDKVLRNDESSALPCDLKVRLRDGGDARTLELHTCLRQGDDGPECFSAVLDVTAREEAQRRQRESDHLRQAVLDAIPAEVVVLDRRGHIIAVNRAWRRFADENGGSAELCDGLGVDYLAACRIQGDGAEDAERIAQGIESVLRGSCPGLVAEYPCHSPRRQRWYALTAAPVASAPAAAVIVHFDITERRLAEERARQARDTMARAARVNALGTLAVSVVHELSQPLSAAGFYSATAAALAERGTDDPDKLKRVLAGVDGQIEKTAMILQRLRDFARQQEALHVAEVAIDEVVGRALALVGQFAADRHVDLSYRRPAPGVRVRGDPSQLEQVLVDLICNAVQAIDYADAQRREVAVGVERRHGEIEVSIHDTGPGVPPAMEDQLFDLFALSRTSGLGMGLVTSRAILEAHDGKLWVDATQTDASGAVFRFTLPCQDQAVARPE